MAAPGRVTEDLLPPEGIVGPGLFDLAGGLERRPVTRAKVVKGALLTGLQGFVRPRLEHSRGIGAGNELVAAREWVTTGVTDASLGDGWIGRWY